MNADRSKRRESSRRRMLVEEELTRMIIGAFFEVYNALGFGFLESTYKRALEIALRRRGLLVDREFPIEIFFGGEPVGFHRVDLLVGRRVIVEVKATHKLPYADRLQLMNYVTEMNSKLASCSTSGRDQTSSASWAVGSRSLREAIQVHPRLPPSEAALVERHSRRDAMA